LAVGQVLKVYNWTTLAIITYDDYSMNSQFRDSMSVLTTNGLIGIVPESFHLKHTPANTTIAINVSLHAADLLDPNGLDAKLSQVKNVTRG
jgi:hypothetical protein